MAVDEAASGDDLAFTVDGEERGAARWRQAGLVLARRDPALFSAVLAMADQFAAGAGDRRAGPTH